MHVAGSICDRLALRKRFFVGLIQPERVMRAERCHLGVVLLRTWS